MKGFGNLLDGYRRFRANRFASERERWEQLAEAQEPRAVVIACSDSRADPATIFDTYPGEIFVIRNVANLVPPFEPDSGTRRPLAHSGHSGSSMESTSTRGDGDWGIHMRSVTAAAGPPFQASVRIRSSLARLFVARSGHPGSALGVSRLSRH